LDINQGRILRVVTVRTMIHSRSFVM